MRQIDIRKTNLATNIIKPDYDPVAIITAITTTIPTIKIGISWIRSLLVPHSITLMGSDYSYTVMYDTKLEGFIAGYFNVDLSQWAAVTKNAHRSIWKANRDFVSNK